MTYAEQRDDLVWAYAALLSLLCAAVVWGQASAEQRTGIAVMLMLLGAVTLVMSWLSVRLTADELRVSLGAGLFTRRIPRGAIAGVRVVPAPSPLGVGVRLLSDGWLYSLRPQAEYVEVRLSDGSRLVIGTREARKLADQIGRA
ncbi:hypothetical protein [Deinococcus radiodurans]|jgi:hypothetical protein|uniref:PH domain-containing protein n=1 Tax=Deinococcus radiodurans (strain ATCC 13939 / DSM 20539 / JCM 16871 / CCUG 27074 / LMG 4051 / NBRC 15346 / NCIMB 9279 / VKM B-1422 / R1) TaxID=243230 RepID=Q9RVG0_DEIRA|nr:hypothetical protein [Deinococcus radiodurans]AAF10646.1 hypothetical protein DR_1069 [Deinococcus radiodurans R1 = ATCC 13939 = DSM 20539]ANC71749.1 hypothetical protein A2G07_08180 [Deinococcus radiodurans R1 = ATCC 13939 = DSM 20539]QEM70552.1 hypothetical protein DXG80_01465 [Deinococcus radiodurans]QIP29159.1 hypothetical protein HAV23_08270 [Deinococcus radiodurans]QIP32145.1 hypothetical protein HAV35_08525 [Deinococcus radiodurans]